MAKYQREYTPLGTAVYPYLFKPDTQFDTDGVYKTDLTVPIEEGQEFMDKVDEAFEANLTKVKAERKGKKTKVADKPYEVNEEEGTVTFKIKVKAMKKLQNGDTWNRQPAFYDTRGQQIEPPKVGAGSKIRVKVELYPWFNPTVGAGITLQPLAVQVVDLVEFGGGGFDAYEGGGYVGKEVSDDYDKEMDAKEEPPEPEDDAPDDEDEPW